MHVLDELVLPEIVSALQRRGLLDLMPFWQMSPAERIGLASVLRSLEIDRAMEIGTAQGGSLAVISSYAEKTYSLDIDPACRERLAHRIDNANIRIGDSRANIPDALAEVARGGHHLDFVLVDGDHSREGVRRDVEAVLGHRPRRRMAIVLHDSFNPFCRYGMRDANWAANPHVHVVELDFVPGAMMGPEGQAPEMWGGLALAILLPEERKGPLVISERNRRTFEETLPRSFHLPYFPDIAAAAGNPPAQSAAPQGIYSAFALAGDELLRGFLEGAESRRGDEPDGYFAIRRRLAEKIPGWRAKGARVAIYGGGQHTRALLGLLPELYPLVTVILDRRGDGEFLGKPCRDPARFSAGEADVVIYSSRAHEREMHASLASLPLEHVRLYA